MAIDLGEYVLCGELIHAGNHVTHGWIQLRGCKDLITFELFGNPAPDLTRKFLRFEARDTAWTDYEPKEISKLPVHPRQIGSTGLMTASRETSVQLLTQLGEAPHPVEKLRELHLSWRGISGEIEIRLINPRLWAAGHNQIASDLRPLPLPDGSLPPEDPGETSVFDESPEVGDENADEQMLFPMGDLADLEEDDEDDLDAYLESRSEKLDLAAGNPPSFPHMPIPEDFDPKSIEDLRELQLMDELIGGRHRGVDLGELTGILENLESLDEAEAERHLKNLVAQIARYHVSFAMCEHFSCKDALKLLLTKMADEIRIHPELVGTGWITHVGTDEYCEACAKEDEELFGEDFGMLDEDDEEGSSEDPSI